MSGQAAGMRIAVYGLGYVGLTAAACMAKQGHAITGVDISEDKVAKISAGRSPIKEPGLEELVAAAVTIGKLTATQHSDGLVNDCDIAIVCVGTPSAPDGSLNMSRIAEVTRQIAAALDPGKRRQPLTLVFRSTVRPGTVEQLIVPILSSVLDDTGPAAVEIVYNPEFLRESSAIEDYFNPPKLVVGTHDGKPSPNLERLYAEIAAPRFYTGYREAEFTKFIDNSWHAAKVAFANEIGRFCVKLRIDAKTVHEIFIADTKLNLSPYYLRPGGAFGGSCLPKDVRALQYIGGEVGAGSRLIDAITASNDSHKHFLFEHCTRGVAPGATVLLLGLAFKAGSDDLRESPNVDLARRLLQAGYRLSIYDPALQPAQLVGENLGYAAAQLPNLGALLVDRRQAETGRFAVAIDANGTASSLQLAAARIVNIHAL
ncbi:MAG: nucleotide sugar dehydrogenase [Hyphomicrobiales bacterium]